MEKFEVIYKKYQEDEISLLDFQRCLEPILGSFNELSKKDEEFIKTTINQIELVIYTIPKEIQKKEIVKLVSGISIYLKTKHNM